MKLILASQSSRRKMLLEKMGVDFDIIVSNADEESINLEDHAEHVKNVAKLKVETVAKDNPDSIILGADSMIVVNSKRLGKPKNINDAIRILNLISGNTHEVYTGIIVKNTKTGETLEDCAKTIVTFRKLTDKEIIEWANHPDCLTGAGAYTDRVHHKFFERLEGSHTNVMGLPMEKAIPMLRQMGVDI